MPIEFAPEDAASALERAGLPVLCPDTSALLDLARLPRKNEREAAAMDFALRQAGSKFIVLIPVQVWREMDGNLDQVLGQVSTELADARAHLIGLRRAAGIIGITTFEIPDIPL